MKKNHIIVIGASAGGIEAVTKLISYLPNDFKSTILIVIHLPSAYKSTLPDIINRSTSLQAVHPKDTQRIAQGHIYIAPPNTHMTLFEEQISLSHGAKIHHTRPAIDPLFYSAARYYGPLAIGIILSGLLDDGVAGLSAIKKAGGITIIQNLEEAEFADMPFHALKSGCVDHTLTLHKIALLLSTLDETDDS